MEDITNTTLVYYPRIIMIRSIIHFIQRYQSLFLLVLSIKLSLFVFIVISDNLIPFSIGDYEHNGYHFIQSGSPLENNLSAYDGQLYLELAQSGYTGVPQNDPGQRIYAFFPLYPSIMKIVSYGLGGNLFLAGILINILFSFLASWYLYKLVLLDHNEKTAIKAVYYFLIFPTAIFLTAIYTEALFLFLSLATLYYCRKHRWWYAGIFGYFAALSRSQGILLVLPFIIEFYIFWKNKHVSPKHFFIKSKGSFVTPLLIPLGVLSFLWYAEWTTGNFFLPVAMQESWGRLSPSLLNIWQTLYNNISHFWALPIHGFRSSQLDVGFGIVFLIMIPFMMKKIRLSYVLYAVGCVLLPLSSASTMSLIRLISVSFPHYILLALWGTRSRTVHTFISVLSLLLLAVFTIRFINWYWAN